MRNWEQRLMRFFSRLQKRQYLEDQSTSQTSRIARWLRLPLRGTDAFTPSGNRPVVCPFGEQTQKLERGEMWFNGLAKEL
jgi:hypothetical protein